MTNVNFHELKTVSEIAAAIPVLCESAVMPWLCYIINIFIVIVTCQSQGSHTLKHTLLCLFYSKWDHNLQSEHDAVLKKTWN